MVTKKAASMRYNPPREELTLRDYFAAAALTGLAANLPTQWYVAKGPERVSRLMPTKQDAEEALRDLELTDAMDRRFLAAHDPATYGGG